MQVASGNPTVLLLMFVDNLTTRATENDLQPIIECLDKFEARFGLSLNKYKSSIFFSKNVINHHLAYRHRAFIGLK